MDSFEPITAELRGKMDTLGWYDEDGDIIFMTGDEPASEMACLVINSKTFCALCDAIDAIHEGLERENVELREKSIRVAEADSQWEYAIKDLERVQDERDALAEALEHAYKKNRNQRKQLTEVQEAIHRRNEGELKQSWLRAKKNLECQIAQLKTCSVPLPKDANGETIFLGDWIEVGDGKKARVEAIATNVVYWWEEDGCHWCQSFTVSLYHKPTVEDVLREFADIVRKERVELATISEDTIAEYAAKLRLAEEKDAR